MQQTIEKKLYVKVLLMHLMQNQQQLQSQQSSMKNLESQIGQLASAQNIKSGGKLPSNTRVPRLENGKECKTIELTSGKALPNPCIVPKIGDEE